MTSEQISSQDQEQEVPEITTIARDDLIARREDVQIDALR